jgi:hypothetical protein
MEGREGKEERQGNRGEGRRIMGKRGGEVEGRGKPCIGPAPFHKPQMCHWSRYRCIDRSKLCHIALRDVIDKLVLNR